MAGNAFKMGVVDRDGGCCRKRIMSERSKRWEEDVLELGTSDSWSDIK